MCAFDPSHCMPSVPMQDALVAAHGNFDSRSCLLAPHASKDVSFDSSLHAAVL